MNGGYGTFSDHSRQAELESIPRMDHGMDETPQKTTQHLRTRRVVGRFGKDIFLYNSGNTLVMDCVDEKGKVSVIESGVTRLES
jgi:hypothetical protein